MLNLYRHLAFRCVRPSLVHSRLSLRHNLSCSAICFELAGVEEDADLSSMSEEERLMLEAEEEGIQSEDVLAGQSEEAAETVTEEVDEFEGEPDEKQSGQPKSYATFMEKIGGRFKIANEPKWLGGDIPFPMNRSFKPPPPLSDSHRSIIYEEYMRDPEKNNVRELAQRHHLSLGRIDAILRLKGMEHAWVKEGKTLQTGFLIGMEKLVSVRDSRRRITTRDDANEADEIEEEPGRQAARDRYERHYWESLMEDAEPIVPMSLKRSKALATSRTASDYLHTDDPRITPRVKTPRYVRKPKEKIQLASKLFRPDLKFVDVGSKFIDQRSLLKRYKASERRLAKRREKRGLTS
ncbi:eukaryotic mitochondrial regulator protein-domain-containing protein [Desarmillaria ectypa]|nr:eukaryotic mitochondrial regulator protein-domain-containing protein [Desarmillaria ectypa]